MRPTPIHRQRRLLLSVSGDRFTPLYWIDLPSERDFDFRIPTRLYVTHGESGVNARRTGLLCYDQWVNTMNTTFENNEVGFHFNSSGGVPSNYNYTGTRFVGNGTGVLLERVPTDQALIFNDCLFSRNGHRQPLRAACGHHQGCV